MPPTLKQPAKKQEKSSKEVDRELDEALKETFPASDPVAITAPGGPVTPDEDPKQKKSGQNHPDKGRKDRSDR
jgi:hypothetical protein